MLLGLTRPSKRMHQRMPNDVEEILRDEERTIVEQPVRETADDEPIIIDTDMYHPQVSKWKIVSDYVKHRNRGHTQWAGLAVTQDSPLLRQQHLEAGD